MPAELNSRGRSALVAGLTMGTVMLHSWRNVLPAVLPSIHGRPLGQMHPDGAATLPAVDAGRSVWQWRLDI
jgi:hypothetical protein